MTCLTWFGSRKKDEATQKTDAADMEAAKLPDIRVLPPASRVSCCSIVGYCFIALIAFVIWLKLILLFDFVPNPNPVRAIHLNKTDNVGYGFTNDRCDVTEVVPGGPAHWGGLTVEDQIEIINGVELNDINSRTDMRKVVKALLATRKSDLELVVRNRIYDKDELPLNDRLIYAVPCAMIETVLSCVIVFAIAAFCNGLKEPRAEHRVSFKRSSGMHRLVIRGSIITKVKYNGSTEQELLRGDEIISVNENFIEDLNSAEISELFEADDLDILVIR